MVHACRRLRLPAAKLNLAVMYLKGVGEPRDARFALDLLNQLAEKKNSRAECYLGILSMEGLGVPVDRAQAEKWFSRAAGAKNPEGEYAMGRFWSIEPGHEHDFARAADFFRHAAHAGYVPAMHALGVLLVQRPNVARHKDEGIVWLRRAAEAGTWQASNTLGILARDGAGGLSRNPGESFFWFNIAVAQGGADNMLQVRADLLHARDLLTPDEQARQIEAAEDWLRLHPHEDLFIFESSIHALFPIQEVYAAAPHGE